MKTIAMIKKSTIIGMLLLLLVALCTGGTVLLLYVFIMFVKEKKRRLHYEKSLAFIRKQLEGLIDSSHAVIYSRNPGSGYPIIYVSENVTDLLGYPPSRLIEDPELWFNRLHPEDREVALSSLNTVYTQTYNITRYRMLDAGGTYRWLQDNTRLIFDKATNPILVLGTWSDITEKITLEEELLKKTAELDNMNKNLQRKVQEEVIARHTQEQILIHQSRLAAMGEMIAVIAHQWKQPLNTLSLIVSDVAEAYSFGEVNRQYVEEFVSEATAQIKFMSGTIDDFRNFFKPSKSKVDFDCAEAVREVVELLSAQLKAFAIDLELAREGNTVVCGYPNEFKQVVLNILNNSVEAITQHEKSAVMPRNIAIRAYNDDDKVVLSISDSGGGIPAQHMDSLFNPYYTTKPDGSGIGLYMARTIIEGNMGGKIHADNTQTGASFVIELSISNHGDH
ncbi:sensor histidine kinase [Candidatus Magnetobacterium casense]|uniref:histidine kinase n=1 Tax=Candidatus Magnetobacterium casense TaxID=1455061 RepID=A0ABS6RZP0_9BACT|nr:ATP-binding protein [Candidatus Magnetobacterium casensis]MBV6342072.1 PAS domain-containing protein [Candidatus Magnetobacterium casensis]